MKKRIHINRLGYMAGMPKTAVCKVTAGIFYLVDAVKGISVYAGRLSHSFFDKESGDTVRLADFSDFNIKGRYFIRAGYRRSDVFEISEKPYQNVRSTVITGIYLNRCGFDYYSDPVAGRPQEKYMRRQCHTEHCEIQNGKKTADVSGGWHSAGGYTKETVSACLAAADMIYALKLFGESFGERERLLVEDEALWGIDWLLKMQDKDGGVFSCCRPENNFEFFSPEEDERQYFLGEKNCASALSFTAVAALAAGYFGKSRPELSRKLKKAAEHCWLWVIGTDEYRYYSGKNGVLSENGDGFYALESRFMWALCEMYVLTGEESFAEMVRSKYLFSSFTGFGGGQDGACGGFAALCHMLSPRQHNRAVEVFIRKRILDHADRMWIASKGSGYQTALSSENGFGSASNFEILSDCMEFILAYLISGEQNYLIGATDQFSYIFGKNPLGVIFVTGSHEDCCSSPSHKLSAALFNNETAIPGMVVRGANSRRSDEYSKWHIEKGSPPAVCYIDSEFSFSTNEPAVHFSAPLIFISAFYDKVGRSALSAGKLTDGGNKTA
ncbi:MAG: glycoside hydrolase family 9 protein [Ruminococcus sp.]|nr:glycoside hydrolase family 9 protein [Ruminococcus sp.]